MAQYNRCLVYKLSLTTRHTAKIGNKHNVRKKIVANLLGALLIISASQVALAEEAEKLPNYNEETLTGDWGGARTDLTKKGIDFSLVHKSDFLSNFSGGIKRGAAWEGHTEARVSLDFEKLAGLAGTTAFVHYHSNLGSKFNTNYVGAVVGVDNIEVATNTAQFYQAWLQKNFFKDQLSLLAGLYAIDAEFYANATSGLFLAPSYGMSNEVALSGQAGPAI